MAEKLQVKLHADCCHSNQIFNNAENNKKEKERNEAHIVVWVLAKMVMNAVVGRVAHGEVLIALFKKTLNK